MDARLDAIARHFQSATDLIGPDPEALPRELRRHCFVCDVLGHGDGPVELVFHSLGHSLEKELARPSWGARTMSLDPEILGEASLNALRYCAKTRTAIWLREAATTSDQSGRVIEMAAVYVHPDRIYGGILYSATAWFFAERPMLAVLPLADPGPAPSPFRAPGH